MRVRRLRPSTLSSFLALFNVRSDETEAVSMQIAGVETTLIATFPPIATCPPRRADQWESRLSVSTDNSI
jgi:hypothetical protein